MGAIEDLIEAAESAFGTIAKWADDRCPVEKWEGLLDAARAELAERGPERVVEVLEISPEHRDGKYRFHVFYTEGDQGSISPDGLRALGLCGPCRLAIRRLPDAPKPVGRVRYFDDGKYRYACCGCGDGGHDQYAAECQNCHRPFGGFVDVTALASTASP